HVFDEVYACSAGALNAAYFLSGQSLIGMKIYYEDVNNWQFLNPFRLWKIVDIDYLFSAVIDGAKRLDVDTVMASATLLFISLLNVRSGEAVWEVAQKSSTPLVTLLKAATAIPLLYNRKVLIGGEEFTDGSWVNPLPL